MGIVKRGTKEVKIIKPVKTKDKKISFVALVKKYSMFSKEDI
jgi:hypothetical protein